MGRAIEVLSGRATNPAATPTALTLSTGDSLTVRNANPGSKIQLQNVWASAATAGLVRVRSPRLHDNVQGIRLGTVAATTRGLLADEVEQALYAQDQLIVEITGGGAEVDAASILIEYDDLPGADARLETYESIAARIRNILTVETSHTTGATAGDYSGGVALNSSFDLLKANTDYALLGYECSVEILTVGWRGPDTGNVRIGGPGTREGIETRDWFIGLAHGMQAPAIPIINSANKAGTQVDLVATQTATAVLVRSILAELG